MDTPYDLPLGDGDGGYAFRMMPDDDFDEGASSVSVDAVANGRAVLVTYTWTHAEDGAQRGTLMLGIPAEDGAVSAAWVDSWHQRDVVQLRGTGSPTGATVGYEYAPGWTWEIEVSVDDGALALVMRNGVPESDDSPAVRYDVMRNHWS
ncbi:hypothetical protein [Nocardioides currus]|uniref:DUF1579 domain-containing protein n=1 Tax=Nocardioides currus TaxID=2133958 RepID=A0A2R7YTA4_9ACTN|nr:hypothetical protein [Nocardioides currus]PUA79618.1 hypothetical protein C7S10_18030 [Nocardioides currus]